MVPRSCPPTAFKSYLSPPAFYRRQKVSTRRAIAGKPEVSSDLSRTSSHNEYLCGHRSHLRCATCATDICLSSQIISKGFTGRYGRAYLVTPSPASCVVPRKSQLLVTSGLPNTTTDPPSQRQLVTGTHTVSDVRCAFCDTVLGWRYDAAEQASQNYKVGKYILETKMICSNNDWDRDDDVGSDQNLALRSMHVRDHGDVQFDSQDEDECEDLFAGTWNPTLAKQRRYHNISADGTVQTH